MLTHVGLIIFLVPIQQMDRTLEALLCEKELMDPSNIYRLPIFLNLSFDEVCVQIMIIC